MDLNENLDIIRKSIGFCPQYDTQYDYLTLKEHLQLVCRIKGFSWSKTQKEIEKVVK